MGFFYFCLIGIVILSSIFGALLYNEDGSAVPAFFFLVIFISLIICQTSEYFSITFSNAKVVKMQSICQKFGGLSEFDRAEFTCQDGTKIKIDSIKLDPESP